MHSKVLFDQITKQLLVIESKGEAQSLALLLLEDLYGIDKTDILVDKPIADCTAQKEQLNTYVARLLNHEPIQHIIGYVTFYGRKFLVNKNVLIPRNETEELVHLILSENKALEDAKIVDIGTGSGIIPISLKKERPKNEVIAIDVSTAALATAKRNATLNNASIIFMEDDILISEALYLKDADIVVSNPPYVMEYEKMAMEEKVKAHDPGLALFVEDDDPLKFYKAIIEKTALRIKEGGLLYFEINEQMGASTVLLLQENNFKKIRLIKDMHGKDRFTVAEK